jgi:hypothetical protein
VEVTLRHEETVDHLFVCGFGHEWDDEVHRTLVQRSGRRSIGVALDTSVVRVRRVSRDPGQFERAGVHPRTVPVAVGQEHRTVRDEVIERLRTRVAAGEHVDRPAAPEDP